MLLTLLVVGALLSQSVAPSDDADIVALEQRLFRAIEEKDRATLEGLMADDYVLRGNPDVTRETWLHNAVTLCWGPRWNLEELTVQEHGDVQIATFILNFYRDPLTCRAVALRSLITDVWERRDGQWKLVVRHAGPVGDVGPRAQYGAVPLLTPLFEGRAELSFVSTGGNASTETLGFSAEAIRRTLRTTTTGRTSFVRTSNDDIENARSLNMLVRHGLRLSERVEAFARGGYLRDLFSGLEHRVNADAGFSYVAPQPLQRALKIDFGVGATREVRLFDANQAVLNATIGGSFRARLRPSAEITAESQGVADFAHASNWRLVNDLSLSTGIGSILSARLSYSLRYANRPVPGFRRTDRTVSAALVFRYARFPRRTPP
jgi:putative salt-induced outer membrane protein YdiY/ketosteroid isomerase-like protein